MTRFASAFGRFLVTAIAIAAPAAVGWQIWTYYMDAPWTRDGRVRADIVAIAPDVSGLVTDVLVHDNQQVAKGDTLFRIDGERFSLAVALADAVVSGRKAAPDIATADLGRYKQLSDNVVPREKLEQETSAQQQADAAHQQSIVDRNLSRLNLARSEVKASVNGTITNMGLQPGEYVAAGKGVLALVDSDSLHVEGYFEETKLPRIHVGDPVEPYSIEGGRAALRRIPDAGTHPTVLVCGSDVLAFGALIECAGREIQVPRDMSVSGFDDLEFAAFLNPPLTTLAVPAIEMGRRAGEYILARLRGRSQVEHVPLETNLILRRTTAPPPLAIQGPRRVTRPFQEAS